MKYNDVTEQMVAQRYSVSEWRFSIVVTRWTRSTKLLYTLSPVSSGMGDSLRAGKQSRYVTSHPGPLNLAILRG